MESRLNYSITSLINDISILENEFNNYEEGKSYFSSREAILELITKKRIKLRKAQAMKLTLLKENKNNSNK